jgi:hypothetical protein
MFPNSGFLVIAALLSVSLGACRARPQAVSQHPDCREVDAALPQIDARVDTAAYSVTVRKGCVLASWLTAFDSAQRFFPDSLADLLRADTAKQVKFVETEWKVDGWGRPFVYQKSGLGVTLRSVGPDGRSGSEDDVEFAVMAGKAP